MVKKKEPKITFKKSPKATGLAAIGSGFYTEAKISKKKFAIISGGSWRSDGVTIQVAISDDEASCGWKWIFLKNNATNEQEGKDFLISKMEALKLKYTLYFFGE